MIFNVNFNFQWNFPSFRDLADTLYDVLGYDHAQDKVKIGALAENTHPQIRTKIEEMLVSMKFEPKHAKEVVDNTWMDTPEDMDIKLTANLSLLFQRLKSEGIKVRKLSKQSLSSFNLDFNLLYLTDRNLYL